MPLASVIVPTLGRRPELLVAAVRSVLEQSVRDVECIVVDNRGTAGTSERLPLPDDARVRVVSRHEPSLPAARNTGLAVATGTFVAFLDDDDTYLPRRLELGIAGCGRAMFDVCFAVDQRGRSLPNRRLEGDVRHVILDGYTPQPGTVTTRRDHAPPFDERFHTVEDIDWFLRAAHAGTFTTTGEVGVRHRVHDDVRPGYGPADRIEYRWRLLEEHAAYFEDHPRAAAFQLLRVGVTASRLGRRSEARSALLASLRARPSARAARQLLMTWAPRTMPGR